MSKNQKLIRLLAVLSFTSIASLQAQNFIPSVAPPEAHAFTKFGEIPVSYYSGVPNIEVPVYTLKDGSASLPINLRYHAGGIRVAEQASWVGLGWNLNVGGVITRTVMGLFDHEECMGQYMDPNYCFPLGSSVFPHNYFLGYSRWLVDDQSMRECILNNFEGPACQSVFGQSSPGCYQELCGNGIAGSERASLGYFQPDVFNLNFLGYSATFYYHFQDQKFHIIKNENFLKVEPIGSYFLMTGLKVTDPAGVVYTFGLNQKKYNTQATGFWQDISSESFFLTEIAYPDGNYLKFTYMSEANFAHDQFYVSESYTVNAPPTVPAPQAAAIRYNADWYIPIYLSEVNSPNIKLTFTPSAPNVRLDIKNSRYLASITVFDKVTTKSRSFTFTYDYFANSTVGGNILDRTFLGPSNNVPVAFDNYEPLVNKRLKLVSFQETGLKPYTFEYNATLLPYKTSTAVDHWGYYNGVNNSTLLPNISKIISAMGMSEAIPTSLKNINGIAADRGANADFMKAGTLERIVYPTGGSTVFEYEPHTFDNFPILPAGWLGNIIESYNVQKIKKGSDLAITSPEMLVPQTVSGSTDFFLNLKINGYVGGIQTGSINGTTEAQRKQEQFNALKNATVNLIRYTKGGSFAGVISTWKFADNLFYGDYDDLNSEDMLIEATMTLSRDYDYGLSVALSYAYGSWDYLGGDVRVEAKLYNTVREPFLNAYSYGGGLRVKKISNYSGDSPNAAWVKSYTYAGGTLMLPLKYVSQLEYYNCGQSVGYFWQSTLTNSNSTSSNLGSISQVVGYDKVTEKFDAPAGTVGNGKIQYLYNNEYLINANGLPAIESRINGTLAQKSIFSESGELLRKTDYFNKYLNLNHYAGFIGDTYLQFPTTPCYQSNSHESIYKYTLYYIYDNNQVLDYTIDREFAGGMERVTSIKYEHNSLGQVVSESTYPVDYFQYINQNLALPVSLQQIKTYYPANPPEGYSSSNYTDMGIRHNLFPLKEERYRSGQKVYERINDYQSYTFATRFNSAVNQTSYLPLSVREKPTSSAATANDKLSEFVFENGNLVQVKGPDGVPVTFIWDYNQTFPVAKIVNATYASVAAQLAACTSQCAGQINCDQKWNFIRTALPDTQVTSYSYSPLDGVVAITDLNGQKSTYQYDSVSRLMSIVDKDGNFQQVFTYHYKD